MIFLQQVGVRHTRPSVETVDDRGDLGIAAFERCAEGTALDPQGSAVHHRPYEKERGGRGDH